MSPLLDRSFSGLTAIIIYDRKQEYRGMLGGKYRRVEEVSRAKQGIRDYSESILSREELLTNSHKGSDYTHEGTRTFEITINCIRQCIYRL